MNKHNTAKIAVVALAIISVFIDATQTAYASSPPFVNAANLSNNAGSSFEPLIAVSESNVYVVWRDSTPGNNDIFFRASNDNGATFNDIRNLSSNTGISDSPRIAVSESNVYVVWHDATAGNDEIFFSTSNDNGATFGKPINLSNNAGGSFQPRIAVSESNVYVVWQDRTPGNDEIFFSTSNDNGATFGKPINLSNNAGGSFEPIIAVSESNVYVVWRDSTPGNNDIFFRASNDNGATFNDIRNLSRNSGISDSPRIAVSESNVYVVWQDRTPENNDIFFSKSNDNGATFRKAVNLSNNAGSSFEPLIAVSESNVYVVWRDSTPGNNDIFFRASNDNGATFNDIRNLSSNTGISDSPRIAVSESNVYVVWHDATPGNDEIFFSKSNDNGATFNDVINLSSNTGISDSPRIVVFGNNIFVAWQETISANDEISFRTTISITIDSLSNTAPKWDLDSVDVAGRTNGDDTDTITIDWGDGTSTAGIPHSDGLWGPVNHQYSSASIGSSDIVAKLLDTFGDEKAKSLPSQIDVQKHETFLDTPTLSSLSVIAGENFSVINNTLIDTETGLGIEGKIITYSGTAVMEDVKDTTVADGSISAPLTLRAVGPENIGSGKTLIANFAGDALYEASTSLPATIEILDTTERKTDVITVTYQDIRFDVAASLSNGSVKSIEVDEDFNSIILSLETSATDSGELVLTLPRALIDSKINGADDDFILIVNGEETEYTELSTTSNERAIMITVFAGAEEVEIFGTQVVPEFPFAVMAVMAVTVATAIALGRFKNPLST